MGRKREKQLNLIKSLLSDGEWHRLLDLANEIGDSTKKVSYLAGQFNVERKTTLDKFSREVRWVKKI